MTAAEALQGIAIAFVLAGCATTPVTSPAPTTPQPAPELPAPAIVPDIIEAAGVWWVTAGADAGVLLCLETPPTPEGAVFNCVTVQDFREYVLLQGTEQERKR